MERGEEVMERGEGSDVQPEPELFFNSLRLCIVCVCAQSAHKLAHSQHAHTHTHTHTRSLAKQYTEYICSASDLCILGTSGASVDRQKLMDEIETLMSSLQARASN